MGIDDLELAVIMNTFLTSQNQHPDNGREKYHFVQGLVLLAKLKRDRYENQSSFCLLHPIRIVDFSILHHVVHELFYQERTDISDDGHELHFIPHPT